MSSVHGARMCSCPCIPEHEGEELEMESDLEYSIDLVVLLVILKSYEVDGNLERSLLF